MGISKNRNDVAGKDTGEMKKTTANEKHGTDTG
jgi:hypothetical protein